MVNILQFFFSLYYTGPKILVYTFLSKMFKCFLSLFVSIQVSDAYVNVLSIIVFCSVNFLRKVFGPKRDKVTGEWRKLHNEELNDLYSLPNIVRVVNE